jgi:hypothetical protein
MHNIKSPREDDESIEAELIAKGLNAPRITPEAIEEAIASEHYFTASEGVSGALIEELRRFAPDKSISTAPLSSTFSNPDDPLGLLTFCVLVLKNGFTVTGESACASPENFDAGIGRRVARAHAKQKIWVLVGYLLKQRLHEGSTS